MPQPLTQSDTYMFPSNPNSTSVSSTFQITCSCFSTMKCAPKGLLRIAWMPLREGEPLKSHIRNMSL